jgi:cephalosporin hydroxylase
MAEKTLFKARAAQQKAGLIGNVADRLRAFAATARLAEGNSLHLRNIELLLAGPCRRHPLEAGLRFEAARLLGRNPTSAEMECLLGAFPGDPADPSGSRVGDSQAGDIDSGEQGLAALRRRFPWPTSIPRGVRPYEAGHFLRPQTHAMLQRRLRERRPDLVVEIGSWLGGSTRVIADISGAHVIAIDTWLGSAEHQRGTEWDRRHDSHREILAQLFDIFAMNCSNYREVITPLRATSLAGLHEVHSHGLRPGLVFIDGAHDKESVAADLRTAHDLFGKNAWIVLDDYGSGESWLRGLEEAANEFAHERGYQIEHNHGACTFHW